MNENIDLIDTFQTRNQSITRKLSIIKIEEQERNKREAFYHENITLILENPHHSWTVPRFRITPEFIQSLIDKKLPNEEGTLLYLREIDGEGLIISRNDNRFNILLKTYPTKYRIEVELPSRTKDVVSSSSYFGDMNIIILGIPKQSQSCLYLVHEEDIRRWLIQNILSEDPDIILAEKEVEDLSNDRKTILEMLQKFPDEKFLNERGLPVKKADAAARHERRYTEMKNEERELRQEYENRVRSLSILRKEKQQRIEFQLSTDELNSSWTISFYGEHKVFNEDIVLCKINWKKHLMYTWDEASKTNDNASLNDDYLVDTTHVTVQRVEHGKGTFYNTKVKCFSDSEFGVLKDHYDFYIGSFDKGKRHGSGIIMNDSHIFIGEFDSDYYAQGTKLYNDGDIVTNSFITEKLNSDCNNPYVQGSENGLGNIRFTDGGIFEGDIKNGELTGNGIYISAIGERFEGEFHQGALVKGLIRDSNGDERRGCFNLFGLLDGNGTWHSKVKRAIYGGYFTNGEMQNGEEVYQSKRKDTLCKYTGLYSTGSRFGTGSFSFCDRNFSFQKAKNDLRIQCMWIGGCPSSGGIITNLQIGCRTPTTNHNSSDHKWLNRFLTVERYKTKKAQKMDAENRREDLAKRNIIMNKKKNMFYQHRSNIEILITSNEEVSLDDPLCTPRIIRVPPRSIEEAEACPGLQRMEYCDDFNLAFVPKETMPRTSNQILKELQCLEQSWGSCSVIH